MYYAEQTNSHANRSAVNLPPSGDREEPSDKPGVVSRIMGGVLAEAPDRLQAKHIRNAPWSLMNSVRAVLLAYCSSDL